MDFFTRIYTYAINDHPEAIAAVFVLMATVYFNYRLQRKNIHDTHKIEFYKKLYELIKNAQKQLNELSNSYQETVDGTAAIGDKYLGKNLEEVVKQVSKETLQKDLNDHHATLRGVLDGTYGSRDKILNLLIEMMESSLLPRRLEGAVSMLHREFNELDADLGQTYEIVKILDPLPKSQNDTNSPRLSVEYFRIALTNIRTTNEKLKRFNVLLGDLKVMVHNDLVGKMLGKKDEGDSKELRLTRKGLYDKKIFKKYPKARPSWRQFLHRLLA
jgi:hypothetical protein